MHLSDYERTLLQALYELSEQGTSSVLRIELQERLGWDHPKLVMVGQSLLTARYVRIHRDTFALTEVGLQTARSLAEE